MRGYPKVTGQRGIQIWVPIGRGPTFADTRAWVEQLSRPSAATVPELVSWEWKKAERGGRARLDYTQNAINKTLVAPYSAAPAPAPGVGADRVGRARRSRPRARPLDDRAPCSTGVAERRRPDAGVLDGPQMLPELG